MAKARISSYPSGEDKNTISAALMLAYERPVEIQTLADGTDTIEVHRIADDESLIRNLTKLGCELALDS